MRNTYSDEINRITADESFKQSMIRNVLESAQASPVQSRFGRCRMALFAWSFAVVFLLAILVPIGLKHSDPSRPAPSFGGFTVTAYAADGTSIAIKPNAEFPLGRYSPFMSSVPGFPVSVSANGAERVEVRASEGELLLWNPSDPRVRGQGNQMDIRPGETFYWSPLDEGDSSAADSASLEITAYRQNEKLGSSRIEIESDDGGLYRAKWIEE